MLALLDAIHSGQLKRDQLTALHVRQLTALHNPEVDRRVASTWGRFQQSPAEKRALIAKWEKAFNEAPLWAYSAGEGRKHFQRLCAPCHVLGPDGNRVGPELSGAGRNGIGYFLENIVDPNAVIGADFQMTTLETRGGDVLSGLAINDTPGALTLRTATGEMVVPKADITRRATSETSLMPEGLLEALGDRERLELLKYLLEN